MRNMPTLGSTPPRISIKPPMVKRYLPQLAMPHDRVHEYPPFIPNSALLSFPAFDPSDIIAFSDIITTQDSFDSINDS